MKPSDFKKQLYQKYNIILDDDSSDIHRGESAVACSGELDDPLEYVTDIIMVDDVR